MSHLTVQQFRVLEHKLMNKGPFSEGDLEAIEHIGECEECYRFLKCRMAVTVVTDRMDLFRPKSVPVRNKVRATINLMVRKADAALDQLIGAGQQWLFDLSAPPAGAGALGMSYSGQSTGHGDTSRYERHTPVKQKLEDLENDRTFVLYDPEQKLLTIQIDGADGEMPVAFLRLSSGVMSKIPFEKEDNLYRAQISGLEDGEYKLILER